MVAFTWPLLSLFWTLLMAAGIFLLIFFVLWCPFLGAVIYIVARPADARLDP
jgi:hypothetical protein